MRYLIIKKGKVIASETVRPPDNAYIGCECVQWPTEVFRSIPNDDTGETELADDPRLTDASKEIPQITKSWSAMTAGEKIDVIRKLAIIVGMEIKE